MPVETSITQTALVVIAVAASIQSLMLIVGGWFALRAWQEGKVQVDRHLTMLHERVDTLTDATRHLVQTVDQGASHVSNAFGHGERLASAVVSAVATPKVVLLASVVGRLASGLRSRSAKRTPRIT